MKSCINRIVHGLVSIDFAPQDLLPERMLFKTLFFSLWALADSGSHLPPVKRYTAVFQHGRDSAKDEASLGCNMDVIRIRGASGEWNILLFLWAEPRGMISFKALIPGSLLPLREGASWTGLQGRPFQFLEGKIQGEGFSATLDPVTLAPLTVDADGEGSFLHCEF